MRTLTEPTCAEVRYVEPTYAGRAFRSGCCLGKPSQLLAAITVLASERGNQIAGTAVPDHSAGQASSCFCPTDPDFAIVRHTP